MREDLGHRRKTFQPPEFAGLSSDVRDMLHEIDLSTEAFAPSVLRDPSSPLELDRRVREGVAHRLSDWFELPVGVDGNCGRSLSEARVLAMMHSNLRCAVQEADSGSFAEALTVVASRFSGVTALRTRAVGTLRDGRGHFVIYPPSREAPRRIDELVAFLDANRAQPRAFRAIVALVWLTNCHPFVDGNGRTARVVFNSLLHSSSITPSFYLPLFEIAKLSRGGYIVRVRQAEIGADWEDLFRYFHLLASQADLWLNTSLLSSAHLG